MAVVFIKSREVRCFDSLSFDGKILLHMILQWISFEVMFKKIKRGGMEPHHTSLQLPTTKHYIRFPSYAQSLNRARMDALPFFRPMAYVDDISIFGRKDTIGTLCADICDILESEGFQLTHK